MLLNALRRALEPEALLLTTHVEDVPHGTTFDPKIWVRRVYAGPEYAPPGHVHVETVRIVKDHPKPLVTYVGPFNDDFGIARFVKANGYHLVKSWPHEPNDIYARSWAWFVLEASSLVDRAMWAIIRSLYYRRFIGITTPESWATRIVDIRPRIGAWRNLRHYEGDNHADKAPTPMQD